MITTKYPWRVMHVAASSALALLSACGGNDRGSDIVDPVATINEVQPDISISVEPPGNNCADGGSRIQGGIDADGDGELSQAEITTTLYVCKGVAGGTGAPGQSTLVKMVAEAPGANCQYGGNAILAGLDVNNSSVLDDDEVTSTGYVCNGADGSNGTDGTNGTDGSNGSNGHNTLAVVETEPVSLNCPYGGVKLTSGLDVNDDGILDPSSEVTSTNYVCNGAGVNWLEVADPNVQMTRNTGFIAGNDTAQVVFTLPPSSALFAGDIIRVVGTGAGGWAIAQNDPQLIYTGRIGGMAGNVWTFRETARRWSSIASSADGRRLVASVNGGKLYTSADGGASWTENVVPDKAWSGVASSADGRKLVAVVNGGSGASGGSINTSIDFGLNWNEVQLNQHWTSVASSADGRRLVAVDADARISISTNSGVGWTEVANSSTVGVGGWRAVTSSADGMTLAATRDGTNGHLYVSIDGGQSWLNRTPAAAPDGIWPAIAASADGQKLIATAPGRLYTSVNAGLTWDEVQPLTGTWTAVASSADGSRLMATGSNVALYTSPNGGATWSARVAFDNPGAIPPTAAAMSASGDRMMVARNGGQLVTSNATTRPGTAGLIVGWDSDAIELQYIGNDEFTVLSHEGQLNIR